MHIKLFDNPITGESQGDNNTKSNGLHYWTESLKVVNTCCLMITLSNQLNFVSF